MLKFARIKNKITMATKKMLIVVDPQLDFINGTLPVPGAESAMNGLTQYIREHGNDYLVRIVTSDWHPYRHCSFQPEGGEWPRHCVQHSAGAAIWQPLLEALNEARGGFTLLYKGTAVNKDEYSIMQNGKSAMVIGQLIAAMQLDQIDVCGLAGDVCVLNTVRDLVDVAGAKMIHVLADYAPSLDGGTALHEYIAANGLQA